MLDIAYFIYRYVFRLGFLDGKEGNAFHVLQGFWYRYLVDMKLHQVKLYMHTQDAEVTTAIRDMLVIDVTPRAQATGDQGGSQSLDRQIRETAG